MLRTDSHNNPAAFTVDIAKQAGLTQGVDYQIGDPFTASGHIFYTARLLGDPIAITIRVIDKIGYFTQGGNPRWIYIALPKFIWNALTKDEKRDVVGFHYMHEAGTEMRHLFPNYGQS